MLDTMYDGLAGMLKLGCCNYHRGDDTLSFN